MLFSAAPIALAQILEKMSDISLCIHQLSNLDEIFNCAVERTQEVLQSDRVLVYQFLQAEKGLIRAEAVAAGATGLSRLFEEFGYPEHGLAADRQGHMIEDCQELRSGERELWARFQIRSSLAVPIHFHNQFWGLFIAHQCDQPRSWQALDIQVLKQIALQLGIAIQQSDLNQRLPARGFTNELIQEVASQTGERNRSEFKQSKEELRSVQDQLQYLLSYAPAVFLTRCASGNYQITYMSRNITALLGYEPHCFTDTLSFWLTHIHPEDRETMLKSISQVLLGNYHCQEFRFLHADGSYRWLSEELSVIRDETGQPIELIGYWSDISDRKAIQDALSHSEERFRIVQELSLDAFTILKSVRDQSGAIVDFEWTYVNPKAAEILRRPISELVGHCLLEVLPGNQENSELFKQYVQVVETGIPHDIELFYSAEGITGWFRNMTVKLEDGIAISFSDITQRKQTEEALRESSEQLQEAVMELERLNSTKDEFLSTVSHELRTPMTNIKMSIRMLELSLANPNSEQRDQKITQYLKILSKECDREINLINDLLDLQRLEAGRRQITLEVIHFQEWLITFIRPFQERTLTRQQTLVLELPDIPATEIYCDLKSLERIVSELLNNACKYTPPQQRIVLSVQLTPEQLQIKVVNFGVEIPAAALPHIFERFYRVPQADPWGQGGTGLGLALVKKMVAYLDGTLAVESGSGRTCFCVTLPLAAPESPLASA